MFDPMHCLTNITSEEKTNGYSRTGAPPICMCMCTREGWSLGLYMLPCIKCTTIRARVANKPCFTLT